MTNTPVKRELSSIEDGDTRNFNVIPLHVGTPTITVEQFRLGAYIAPHTRPNLDDAFTKVRVVSAGLRVFKTSSSDTESGTLDLIYSPEGAPFDNDHPLG